MSATPKAQHDFKAVRIRWSQNNAATKHGCVKGVPKTRNRKRKKETSLARCNQHDTVGGRPDEIYPRIVYNGLNNFGEPS